MNAAPDSCFVMTSWVGLPRVATKVGTTEPPMTPKMYLTPASASASTRYSAALPFMARSDARSPLNVGPEPTLAVSSPKGAPRYKGATQHTGRAGCLDDNALVDATSDMPRVSRFRCLRWVVSKLIRANPSRRTSDVTDASSWVRPMEACLGAVQRLEPNRVHGPQ